MSDQPIPPERPLFPPANAAVPPPPRRPAPLSLPRRPPPSGHNPPAGGLISLAYADAPIEVQRKIEQRLNSRSPFPNSVVQSATASAAERERLMELERLVRQREQEMDLRERALEELQSRLADREREIAELENLLLARERLVMVQRKAPTMPPFAASQAESDALEKLRATLDAQEAALAEAKAALKEREAFVEQSEVTLMNKVAAQQEHEITLEQREEDLRRAEIDLRKRLAVVDPAAAAEIEAERRRQRDEFNE